MPISRKSWSAFAFAFLTLVAVAASARAETLGFSLQDSATSTDELTITVLNESTLQPVAEAKVSAGENLERSLDTSPVLRTDADGSVRVPWAAGKPQAITASKEGFSAISIVGVQTRKATIYLKPLIEARNVVASGDLGGWQPPVVKNSVQAGIVFKSLSVFDLLSFRVESMISPLQDTIDVLGPRKIPSNLVLPEQDVFLPFGSITLNKPGYRLPLSPGRPIRISAVQGEVSVNDLLPLIQSGGKTSMTILNKLHFTRIGLTSVRTPISDFKENFDTIITLAPKHQVIATKPPFPANVVVAAVTDLSGDRQTLLATDIKTAIAEEKPDNVIPVTVSAPVSGIGASRDVISFAVGDHATRISGILSSKVGKVVQPGPFLPIDEVPEFETLPEHVDLAKTVSGVSAAFFMYHEKAAGGEDDRPTETQWTVYVLPAAGSVSIPVSRIPGHADVSAYSLMNLEFDSSFDERSIDGTTLMSHLQRFARAQVNQRTR